MTSRIRAYYESLMKTPSTSVEEEDRQYFLANKLLLIAYYLSGGFYHATGISKQVKYIYAIVNFVTLMLLVFSGATYYIIRMVQGCIPFDLLETFGFVPVIGGCCFVSFIFPLFYTYFSREIHDTLSFLSTFRTNFSKVNFELGDPISRSNPSGRNRIDDEYNSSELFKESNLTRFPILVYLLVTFLLIVHNSSPLIHYILFLKGKRPPLAADYPLLPPHYDRIQAFVTYIFVAGLYVILLIPLAFSVVCVYPFILLLPAVLHNNAADICKKMNLVSQNFTRAFETIKDKKIGSKRITSRNRLIYAFEKDLHTLMKEYVKCNKCVQTIHPVINHWMSLGGAFDYTGLLAIIALLVTVTLDPFQIFSLLCMQMSLLIGMCIVCDAGKTFEDMDDSYRYAVYNLPWFYLPPKTRKVVNILQTIMCNKSEFKLLWVYPFNMALFPRVCQSAHSCANLLRAMNQGKMT